MASNDGFFHHLDRLVDMLNVIMLFTGGNFGKQAPENAPDFVKKAYGIFGKDDEHELLIAIRLLPEADQDLLMEFLDWLFTPQDGDWVQVLEGMVKRNAFTSFLTKTYSDEGTKKELERIVIDLKSNSDKTQAFTQAYNRLRRPPIGCRRVGEWDVDWKGWLRAKFPDIPEDVWQANWANAQKLVTRFLHESDRRIAQKAEQLRQREAELPWIDRLIRKLLPF